MTSITIENNTQSPNDLDKWDILLWEMNPHHQVDQVIKLTVKSHITMQWNTNRKIKWQKMRNRYKDGQRNDLKHLTV